MNWNDVLQLAKNNPAPPKRVEKTDEEWKRLLTPEQYRVTRQHGTERPFSGEYCEIYTAGLYKCVCCGTELFDSTQKFNSSTGWPSFTEPSTENVLKYRHDKSFGMQRIEVLCNVCDAHLGHVFPDGPAPSGLRFCINSVSLKKEEVSAFETVTFGSGCFWCTEAVFNELEGVTEVVSGYAGGTVKDPTYRQVTAGDTGHAEVVQLRFDPKKISYANLLRIFFATHNPTSLNRQGADVGTQYRSVILFHNEAQQQTAREIMQEMQAYYDKPIVTEMLPFTAFYKAEEAHQNYYRDNPDKAYCQIVITPKLQKLRSHFNEVLKRKTEQI
jgi:peptide methionine sulfoxide reductase msrA/msrB